MCVRLPWRSLHCCNYIYLTTLIDATHIFDGLNEFPTHVAHMRLGAFVTEPSPWPFADNSTVTRSTTPLYRVALQWLRDDRDHRRKLEKSGRKVRGARKDTEVRQHRYSDRDSTCDERTRVFNRSLLIPRLFIRSELCHRLRILYHQFLTS